MSPLVIFLCNITGLWESVGVSPVLHVASLLLSSSILTFDISFCENAKVFSLLEVLVVRAIPG